MTARTAPHEPARASAAPAGPPAPAAPRHRRPWRIVRDARLQLGLGAYVVLVAGALSALLCLQLWRAYREASRLVALGDPRSDAAIAALLQAEDRSRMLWMLAALAPVLLALFVLAVVVTHRIAGPARALGAVCRGAGDGPLVMPRPLRRHDRLAGLGRDVAAMISALRAREERERAALLEAMDALPRAPERARPILERLAAEKARRLQA